MTATGHMQTVSRPPTALVAYALLGLTCLAWGSTWLVIKWGVNDLCNSVVVSSRSLEAQFR